MAGPTITFEQPGSLNRVRHRCVMRALRPLLGIYCIGLSAMVLFGLWRKASSGYAVPPLYWAAGCLSGLLTSGVILLLLRFDTSRRRCISFTEDSFVATQCGLVAFNRLYSWSLTPDSIEPQYTRFQFTYRSGLGQKQWSMLLSDDAQVVSLREILRERLPKIGIIAHTTPGSVANG